MSGPPRDHLLERLRGVRELPLLIEVAGTVEHRVDLDQALGIVGLAVSVARRRGAAAHVTKRTQAIADGRCLFARHRGRSHVEPAQRVQHDLRSVRRRPPPGCALHAHRHRARRALAPASRCTCPGRRSPRAAAPSRATGSPSSPRSTTADPRRRRASSSRRATRPAMPRPPARRPLRESSARRRRGAPTHRWRSLCRVASIAPSSATMSGTRSVGS